MVTASKTREEWLAAAPVRSPEMEQAMYGGDVPAADSLPLDEINQKPIIPIRSRLNEILIRG